MSFNTCARKARDPNVYLEVRHTYLNRCIGDLAWLHPPRSYKALWLRFGSQFGYIPGAGTTLSAETLINILDAVEKERNLILKKTRESQQEKRGKREASKADQ